MIVRMTVLFCWILTSFSYFQSPLKTLKDILKVAEFHAYIFRKKIVFEISYHYNYSIFLIIIIIWNRIRKYEIKILMLQQKFEGIGTCCGNIQLVFCLGSCDILKFTREEKVQETRDISHSERSQTVNPKTSLWTRFIGINR